MNDLIVMLVVILMINILIILCMQMIFASLHPLKHILQNDIRGKLWNGF